MSGWSGFGSLIYAFNTLGAWFVFLLLLVLSAGLVENIMFGTPVMRPENTKHFLAIVAPLVSLAAMGSPLLSVIGAVRRGNPDHGIQTRLVAAFLFCSLLGVAYGQRKNLPSLQTSCFGALCVQCVSMSGVYALTPWPEHLAQGLVHHLGGWIPVIGRLFRRGGATHAALSKLFKWVNWIVFLGGIIYAIFLTALAVPIDTVLNPVFTACNLLPYVATFSTFPRDIKAYRDWALRAQETKRQNKHEQIGGPPGVDLRTLCVMQINNILWTMYGILVRDSAVIISSSAGFTFAATQINCFYLPVYEVTLRKIRYSTDPRPCQPIQMRLDAAWLFTRGGKSEDEVKHSDGVGTGGGESQPPSNSAFNIEANCYHPAS